MDDLVFGVSMMRDEADVVDHVIGHMLRQVDRLLIADNGSIDGTYERLLSYHGDGVTVIRDEVPGYYQSAKMTRLATMAREMGARWIVPFDADEIWWSKWGRIADVLTTLPATEGIVEAPVFDHVSSALDDPAEDNPFRRIRHHRTERLRLPKIACRAVGYPTIAQGNHGVDYGLSVVGNVLEVRHFPYRSPEQFVRKVRNGAAAYRAAPDLPEDAGAHWRQYGQILDDSGERVLIDEVYRRWFYAEAAALIGPEYVEDPAPIR